MEVLGEIVTNKHQRGWHSVQKPTVELDDISFNDVIDTINPLKKIPFSEEDSSTSSAGDLLLGGLLGGPIGLAMSAINAVFKEATGQDVLENTLSLALDGKTEHQQQTQRYQSIADAHKSHFHTWSA